MPEIQIIQDPKESIIAPIIESNEKLLQKLRQDFQPKEPEEYLTRAEVVKLLKVNQSTLWAWTKAGKLKSYGLGNRVYYKRSEIEAAIKPLNS